MKKYIIGVDGGNIGHIFAGAAISGQRVGRGEGAAGFNGVAVGQLFIRGDDADGNRDLGAVSCIVGQNHYLIDGADPGQIGFGFKGAGHIGLVVDGSNAVLCQQGIALADGDGTAGGLGGDRVLHSQVDPVAFSVNDQVYQILADLIDFGITVPNKTVGKVACKGGGVVAGADKIRCLEGAAGFYRCGRCDIVGNGTAASAQGDGQCRRSDQQNKQPLSKFELFYVHNSTSVKITFLLTRIP